MKRLGLFIIMTAFLGVMAFAVLGMTRNMELAIKVHGSLVLGISLLTCIRKRSLRKAWLSLQPAQSFGHHHPAFIMIIGLLFMIVPPLVAFSAEPGVEANSMTMGEQIYFGCLFVGLGAGVALIGAGVWRDQVREKSRNQFISNP